MKSNYVFTIIIMLIIVMYPLHVKCTQCYQCKSDEDTDCNEDVIDKKYLQECPARSTLQSYSEVDLPEGVTGGSKEYCRKVLQYIKFVNSTPTTIVVRECARFHREKDACYLEMTQAFSVSVCECKLDGCNAGHVAAGTISWFLLLLLGLRLFSAFPP